MRCMAFKREGRNVILTTAAAEGCGSHSRSCKGHASPPSENKHTHRSHEYLASLLAPICGGTD